MSMKTPINRQRLWQLPQRSDVAGTRCGIGVKQSDIDGARKDGQTSDFRLQTSDFRLQTSDDRAKFKAMEREIRELRQANEILRKASAYFAPPLGDVNIACRAMDNALAETINGLYKAEVIHWLGPWKTMAAVEWETLKWVDWFNNRRRLEPIGYIPPAEAVCTVKHIRYGRPPVNRGRFTWLCVAISHG